VTLVMHPKSFTVSERYARLLLMAWYQRKDGEFSVLLESAPKINTLASGEQERVALIQDLAGTLVMPKQVREDDLNAALQLIHQLARWTGINSQTATSSI
jgi:hypothetical protein